MKKFNAKKIIVSGAIGMLLLGGTVAAADVILRWQGEQDVAQISENLDTLDELLNTKEREITRLSTAKEGLETKINTLMTELGLIKEGQPQPSFEDKLTAIIEASKKDKAFSDKSRAILAQIEEKLHITVTDSENVNARAIVIYDKAVAYHGTLTTQISDLEKDVEDLEAAAVTAGTYKEKVDAELNAAKVDVENLKTKSSNIIRNHGGTVVDAPTVSSSTESPVTQTEVKNPSVTPATTN